MHFCFRAFKVDLTDVPGALARVTLVACNALPWVLAGALLVQVSTGAAQTLPADPQATVAPTLQKYTPAQRQNAPVYLEGDAISGSPDISTRVQGDAVLRKADTTIRADVLDYYAPTDLARASGNVHINRAGNLYDGPLLELQVETFEGFFQQPSYHFAKNGGNGEASRADFLDESHTVVHDATYTTCRRIPGPSWVPDWILKAATITLDNDREVGEADDAYLSFKGVPFMPIPPISFPLTDKRKSGLLPFTFDVDNINGTSLTQPYYWNIAPNRDLTLTPTLMTSRGMNLGAEYRYLEPGYSGKVTADYMPGDALRNADRWGLAILQSGTLNTGIAAVGNVNLLVNINQVSDDNYWKDFTRSSASLTQRLLPSDIQTSWAQGSVSTMVRVLKWQTLQDPAAPIVPPYDRMPEVSARYAQINDHGFDWSVEGDFTQFQADQSLTLQPNAQRAFTLAQISRPWLAPEGYITPKVQLHVASYQFDSMLADGSRAASSTVPTFSLDSGLEFERNTEFFGRKYLQTLEPRAFYVYTPFHDQSLLPNYDTGLQDFNFASIYTENAFVGNDKISDNNLLTLGVSTRFLDPEDGSQVARFGIAQRLRFEEQLVTLNSSTAPADSGLSDLLLGAGLNLSPQWSFDSTVQYNAITGQSVQSNIGGQYNPTPYRVINMAYRFQRDVSEQIDLSWQWPINDLWGDRGRDLGPGRGQGDGRYYAVGRLNYALDESSLVDTVLGVEYDAGCWLGRIVYSRTLTSTATATERLMFQLEFVGFSRLGIDPHTTLTQNISHYQNLRDAGGTTDSTGAGN